MTVTKPRFLGDNVVTPLRGRKRGDTPPPEPPELPGGWGAIACQYSFTSSIEVMRGDRVVAGTANYDVWIPPPTARVDGREVPANWSGWWYPLRPGLHQIEVCEPAAAEVPVLVEAGSFQRVHYRVEIRIRRGPTTPEHLGWRSKATLSQIFD
ncbi:MAG TPA: hypothetical protein VIR27_04770 [Mycobacteriales bacterium]